MAKKLPQVVNLVSINDWHDARPLFPIMAQIVFPKIREMPLQELLFFSFLAGIHVLIEAQEREGKST